MLAGEPRRSVPQVRTELAGIVECVNLSDRLVAHLRSVPPGQPVAVDSLASELHTSVGEIISAATALEQRRPGDKHLVTVVEKTDSGDATQFYVTCTPIALNDEPDVR